MSSPTTTFKKENLFALIEENNLKPVAPLEVLSLLVHSIMKELHFRFVGCGKGCNQNGTIDISAEMF